MDGKEKIGKSREGEENLQAIGVRGRIRGKKVRRGRGNEKEM